MDDGGLDPAEIVRYIRANCANVDLDAVAARFSCHRNSVTRVLRRELGSSFTDVLEQARMDIAREVLARGDATVAEAARACGYVNMTRFYRVFERACGCTPGEYRRRALLSVDGGKGPWLP